MAEPADAGSPTVVFDIDGTLLDSAPGIIAGFQHALRSVGFPAPEAAVLRRDLGPPVGDIFTSLGLPADLLTDAVHSYRAFYLERGLQQSRPYPGVLDVLERLRGAGVMLATATAKRTQLATAILEHHRMDRYFDVLNGTDDQHHTKTETLGHTLELLGHPPLRSVLMVGDRHSDFTAARQCSVSAVGVRWGYGSPDELDAARVPLVRRPAELLQLPLLRSSAVPTGA